ncbi:MAG: exo-beta-N-acetylmuramidase NamZ domain-containing protein [Anaerolineales bacterium]
MLFGIDRLQRADFAPLQGQRVGLFTNLSAVDGRLTRTYDIFRVAPAVDLRAFFSPEHGLAGSVADGVKVASGQDAITGLPVHSLYGEALHPTQQMLAEVEVIVCDIQDIGVRYYTYLWTLTHILEACGEHGVRVMILDRPNPLGKTLSGGGLDPALASIVGRYDIPVQHGMTLGELAQMINSRWNPTPAEINVIPCEGWQRDLAWRDLKRPFIPPSPNMPHFSTVQHYPGACLVEGTELSEGRGTPLPFEVVGAPFIDGYDLAQQITIPGAIARPIEFTPSASKFAHERCEGIQLHITDATRFAPLPAWLQIIAYIRHRYPEAFAWKAAHFDRLIGHVAIREAIDTRQSLPHWDAYLADFRQARQPYLIYGD